MPMFDHKNQCESHPTIFSGTAGIAALTGTAVDLAKAVGAMVLFTFGSAIGTAAVAPYIHESSDNVSWGTADFQGGGLVGTTTFTGSGGSRLLGYTGSKRYIRGYLASGGALQAGTAVGGTTGMRVDATVITFLGGHLPVTGT